MKRVYSNHIDEFKGYDDDRHVYVKTYEQIMEALECLPEDPPSYIKVAMFHQLCKDEKVLYSIIDRFCDMD